MSQQPPRRPSSGGPARGPAPRPPAPGQRPAARDSGAPAERPVSRSARQMSPPPPPSSTPTVLIGVVGSILLILVLAVVLLVLMPPNGGTGATGTLPTATGSCSTCGATVAPPAVVNTPAGMAQANVTPNPNATVAVPPIPGLTVVTGLSRDHITTPTVYAQVPPIGGPHYSNWLNCGVYDQPVENERAVHSLEHGAIWITYQPGLAADQLKILVDLTHQSGYRLLSPYPGLPHPIVASAWGYQLPLDRADDPRLQQFIAAFEQNPNGPEPGAPCSGG